MKTKVFFLIIAMVSAITASAQTVKVRTNECVELLNTLWLLAQGTPNSYSYSRIHADFRHVADHKVIDMFKRSSPSCVLDICMRFEYVVLPEIALKMNIANGKITINSTELTHTGSLYPHFKRGKAEDFLSCLNDFYQKSNFHNYYNTVIKQAEKQLYTPNIDIRKLNAVLGSNISDVQYIVPVTRLDSIHGVPYVYVDDALLSMFYDEESELQYPSEFTRIDDAQFAESRHLLGLITALYTQYDKEVSCRTSGFTQAALTLLFDHCKDCALRGYQVWNFMSKWVPVLLLDQYYADSPKVRAHYTSQMLSRGFFWHPNAIDYMQYYYSNRHIYKTIADFRPQMCGYVAHLGKVADYYEVRSEKPYVTDVYPAPDTDLCLSQDSVVVRIRFSKPIASISDVNVNALYTRSCIDSCYRYTIVDNNTVLSFSISSDSARKIGFSGISIDADSVKSIANLHMDAGFSVNYYHLLNN